MIDSVVDLVEEHVDLDGSQFFWINCRTLVLCAYFTTECCSPGIRKSMLASFTIIGSLLPSWSAMDFPFFYEVLHRQRWTYRFHEKNVLESCLALPTVLRVATSRPVLSWICSTLRLAVFRWTCLNYLCLNRSHRSVWRTEFFAKRINIDPGNGTCFFHLACYQVAPICHELDLELVGLVGKFLLVEQLLLLIVEQLPNPILFSIRPSMRSLVEAEVTCILSRKWLLQFPSWQLMEYNKLEVFLEGWLHSIEFDRMSILSESQDQYRPNIPRLDVSSMHCAGIVHDVVHSSQSFQDPCDFCL